MEDKRYEPFQVEWKAIAGRLASASNEGAAHLLQLLPLHSEGTIEARVVMPNGLTVSVMSGQDNGPFEIQIKDGEKVVTPPIKGVEFSDGPYPVAVIGTLGPVLQAIAEWNPLTAREAGRRDASKAKRRESADTDSDQGRLAGRGRDRG